MALQPAQQSLRKFYPVTSSGFNSRFDPTLLKDSEAAELINLQINQDGTLSKYPGYSKNGSPFPNSTDSFIRMLYNFKRGSSIDTLLISARDNGNTNATYKVDVKSTIGDGTYTYIAHTRHTATFTNGSATVSGVSTTWLSELKAGDKIKNAVDADSEYKEISVVVSNTSLTLTTTYGGTSGTATAYKARKLWDINGIPRATTFDNFAVITNGLDTPQVWDNTSLDSITDSDAPKAKYLEVHKNRLFMANTSGNPSRLYWSATNDPQTWDPVSTEDVSIQDGGDIVAIKSFSNSMIVFKSNGTIHQVIGNFDQNAQGVPDFVRRIDSWENIGVIAERSPVVHNNSLYFVCETGVYRIDPRMFIEKVSFLIDPFISTLNFSLAGAVNKAFSEVTKAQWDAGTQDGTWTDTGGTTQSFFDEYSQTDALQGMNLCSVAVGSDNTVYVAYVPNSDATQINFVRYRPGGSVLGGTSTRKETSILTSPSGNIFTLSIAINNNDKTVGIVFATINSISLNYVERSADTPSPFAYGTWGPTVLAGFFSSNQHVGTCHLIFNAGGTPFATFTGHNTTSATAFVTRSGLTWLESTVETSSHVTTFDQERCVIAIDNSANLFVSAIYAFAGEIRCFKSVDGGGTWSKIDTYSLSNGTDVRSALSLGFNHAGHALSVISDTVGALLKRDHTATTVSTILTTSGLYSNGWFPIYNTIDAVNVDTDNYVNVTGLNPNSVESIQTNLNTGASLGNAITNSTTNVILDPLDGSKRPGMCPLVNNSRVMVYVAFGTNTNEVIVKRLAPFAVYLGPQFSDSTLSAWGTYVVTNEIDNSNTVTHAIALGSISNPTTFTTITSGTTISNNASLIFIINRVITQLQTWTNMSIQSIVMNYQGAGVDAKQIVGQEFFSEIFYAVCETGNTTNNKVLVHDVADAPLKTTYAVASMSRYKTNLWAGSCTNGDLYILKQGYSFNGSSYSSDFISKEDFLEFMERDKEIYKIFLTFKTQSSGSFVFSYRFNNFSSVGGSTWNTVTVDQTQGNTVGIDKVAGNLFRSIQFRVQDSNNGVPISLIGITVLYGLMEVRDQ